MTLADVRALLAEKFPGRVLAVRHTTWARRPWAVEDGFGACVFCPGYEPGMVARGRPIVQHFVDDLPSVDALAAWAVALPVEVRP